METTISVLSKNQLAQAYGIPLYTLSIWLKPFEEEIGKYRGRIYTPKQVAIIFSLLGKQ
jgi:hypothetical protein